jgi:hypothetical protein
MRDPGTTPLSHLDEGVFCANCGYDLRARTGDVCPECGADATEVLAERAADLPWAHRVRVGHVRAFVLTVLVFSFGGRRLREQIGRPVRLRDARQFARRVGLLVGVAWAGLALPLVARSDTREVPTQIARAAAEAALLGPRTVPPSPLGVDVLLPWAACVQDLWFLAPPLLVLGITLAAGAQTYWFHPRHLADVERRRAVAMGYYAIAPMAFLAFPPLLIGLLALLESGTFDLSRRTTYLATSTHLSAAIAFAAAAVLLALFRVDWLLRRAARAGLARRASAIVGVPLAWAACALLGAFGWPWLIGWAWLMIDSYRG